MLVKTWVRERAKFGVAQERRGWELERERDAEELSKMREQIKIQKEKVTLMEEQRRQILSDQLAKLDPTQAEDKQEGETKADAKQKEKKAAVTKDSALKSELHQAAAANLRLVEQLIDLESKVAKKVI